MEESNYSDRFDSGNGNKEADLTGEKTWKPTLKQVGILYSVAVILLLFFSKYMNKLLFGDFYFKAGVSELLLVLAPPIIFLLIFKFDIKKVLRIKKISFLNIFIVFWSMVFAMPAVGALNFINMLIINLIFGKTIPTNVPQITTSADLIKGIIAIGLSAGICEETLFRGTIQRGFERFGAVKSIILTAFLFGLMHHDFQKLLGTFLLGAIIGFIVYRTDSIFGGMFAHFTNNSIVVLLSFGIAKFSEFTKSSGLAGANGVSDSDKYFSDLLSGPKVQLFSMLFVWSMIFLVFITAFLALMYALVKNTSHVSRDVSRKKEKSGLKNLFWLLPGVGLILFVYFAEVLELKGINIETVNMIRSIMGF